MMKNNGHQVRVGFLFGAIGVLLTVVGIMRGEIPSQPVSIIVALVLGGGVWFFVAWAVATAARDVEADVAAQVDAEPEVVATEK